MGGTNERIDGWKAIGAHFGRDRTTAMRWAKERGLPVYAVPGGKTRTVYALRAELSAWSGRGGAEAERNEGKKPAAPVSEPLLAPITSPPPVDSSYAFGRAALATAAVIMLVGGLFWWKGEDRGSPSNPLPRNPAIARLFVEARDRWAERTAPSVAHAVHDLEEVTRRDPRFAPGWAALADAYLLDGEFGDLPDAVAFAKARQAAERANKLDPDSAQAHRAIGFIAYWWEHDHVVAGRAFREALRLIPDDAQTHFWYANILADNGEFASAFREYDRARLLHPGSLAIKTDLAWAMWQAGKTAEGTSALEAIAAEHPGYEEAQDCLSMIHLGQGDLARFADAIAKRAQMRGEPELVAFSRAMAQARGGPEALKPVIMHRYEATQYTRPFPDRVLPAFVASSLGDRPRLLAQLRLADAHDERWWHAGYRRAIAARWREDDVITGLLARRAPPPIEAESR